MNSDMANYTKIQKSSAGNYMNLNPQGKEQYDQSNIIYDDTGTFYDGVNTTQYTKVSKATAQGYTKIAKPT